MRRILFTNHAKDRCIEYGFEYRKLKDWYKHSAPVWVPDQTMKTNRLFHERIAGKTIYRWFSGVLYTVLRLNKKDIILTVTPKTREEIILRSEKEIPY